MMIKTNLVLLPLILGLTACGSDSEQVNSSISDKTSYTGVFLDSAVENLHYSTNSGSGVTNELGQFTYEAGDDITFSIGDLTFPTVSTASIITPLTIFDTEDYNETSVTNMLILLQSLDDDGDVSNAIQIPELAHSVIMENEVDFLSETFSEDINALLVASGGVNLQAIDAVTAQTHFQETLADNNLTGCASSHEKVGQTGYFDSFQHGVSGLATIIDDCTIQISEFNYDGGGPLVYVYAGTDHDYNASSAFIVSELLTGSVFVDGALTLTLPIDKTLDDLTGLSVWCVDFSVDFGNLTFTDTL